MRRFILFDHIRWCLHPIRSSTLLVLLIINTAATTKAQPLREASDAPAANTTDEIQRPKVRTQTQAQYPPDALAAGQGGTAILNVTILEDGTVGDVTVASSAGASLDNAAITAVKQWTFSPAQQNATPVTSRIRIPFAFVPPQDEPTPAPHDRTRTSPPPAPDDHTDSELDDEHDSAPDDALQDIIDVTITGERKARTTTRSTSDFSFDPQRIQSLPQQEAIDVLRAVPGVHIARPEGGAIAHHYTMRGFDAEHGQDIAFNVGGIPINQPSHLHGQGYADLGFLIENTVQNVEAKEGIYDPQQGDFAVAGSMNLTLGVEERGVHLYSSYGRFRTLRETIIWAPKDQHVGTFGAVQYNQSQGFGHNRESQSANATLQYTSQNDGPWTLRWLGIFTGADANMAGMVRADDVQNGAIGYDDVYPFATARAQGAFHTRALVGGFADYLGDSGDSAHIGVWFGYNSLRLLSNFTGFTHESSRIPSLTGRGDLIEQNNQQTSIGLQGRYRTGAFEPATWARGHVEVGMDGRIDSIGQSQNMLDASHDNERWDQSIHAKALHQDIGMWGDLDWRLTRYVNLRIGLRADLVMLRLDDLLYEPSTQQGATDNKIAGRQRTAHGATVGPRTSLALHPLSWMDILVAYGEGFRSMQALVIEDNQANPFTKVRSADAGLRFEWQERYTLTIGGYHTRLSDDLIFEADEGHMERIGATRRMGALLYLQARPLDWLNASMSLTYVRAQVMTEGDDDDDDDHDHDNEPFVPGQKLLYVPPVMFRADLSAHHTLKHHAGKHALKGRLHLGFTYLAGRPLTQTTSSEASPLLDASAGLSWGPLALDFEAYNLLNHRYAAEEFSFVSNWQPSMPTSDEPMHHTAAAAPFSWMLTLRITL